MAFFNEFPHTRTYDSDLAWLIKRMKEVLTRMDTLEEKMAALEKLMSNFLDTADDMLRNIIQQMIDDGSFAEIIATMIANYGSVIYSQLEHIGYVEYALDGTIGTTIVNTFIYSSVAPRYTIHTPTAGELTLTMNLTKSSFMNGSKLFSIMDIIDVDSLGLYVSENYDCVNSFITGQMIPVVATLFTSDGVIVDVVNGFIKVSEYNSTYIDTDPYLPLSKLASLHIPNYSGITFNGAQIVFTVKLIRK